MKSAMHAATWKGATAVDDAPESCMLIKNLIMMRMSLHNLRYFPCFDNASSKGSDVIVHLCWLV